jgi:hypothetical protein
MEAYIFHTSTDDIVETAYGERFNGCFEGEEYLTTVVLRSDISQVTDDCVTYDRCQWIVLDSPLLRTKHRYLAVFPVDVIETELCNFARSQSIQRKEHNDSTVTDIILLIRLFTSSHVGPEGKDSCEKRRGP